MIKLLEMQVVIRVENEQLEGCNCNLIWSSGQNRRLETKSIVLPELRKTFSNFAWASGRHSAPTGHENLYNECYTATMERSAKPLFD